MNYKKILLTALFVKATSLFAQTPLTLTSANFPKPSTYKVNDGSSILTIPITGNNATWDYGTNALNNPTSTSLLPAIDPFFSGSCDVFRNATASVGGLPYAIDYYLVTNSNHYAENAFYVPFQPYDISAGTGGANDSMIFPMQKKFYSQPRTFLNFPVTAGYTHQSVTRCVVDFSLSVASYFLNHTPGQHVINTYRYDTVACWGKMRLYTPSGNTIYYDVLGVKSWEYQADSFYLNGAPALAVLIGAFGATQGQHSLDNNNMSFYRTNRAVPLMQVLYDSSPFSSFSIVNTDADSLTVSTDIESIGNSKYSTIVYPNPVVGSTLNFEIYGSTINDCYFELMDVTGRCFPIVNKKVTEVGKCSLSIPSNLSNGNYFLQVIRKNGQRIATEPIIIENK